MNSHQKWLVGEAEALLTRLNQIKPFAITMPMVGAANIPVPAQKGIHNLLVRGVRDLRKKVKIFIRKVKTSSYSTPKEAQNAYTVLKLKFNSLLDQLDIFADVLTQRSEQETGVWLAGLDTLAKDALSIMKAYKPPPPLVCYLDRGHGAAIRRAKTRLPGGKKNPVGVIKIPRERMVSNGIASSLIHEVGHQGAALLGLIKSVKNALHQKAENSRTQAQSWKLFSRWISEILADCWSAGMVGVSATTGLMGVVSLPRYFVFRSNTTGPHPFPWIRVKISCAFGEALYPDPQWRRIDRLWGKLYPLSGLPTKKRQLISELEKTIPHFVKLVLNHRPATLNGKPIKSLFPTTSRKPKQLRALHVKWKTQPTLMKKAKPSLVFAVMGQARSDNRITPKKENQILTEQLKAWAMKRHHGV